MTAAAYPHRFARWYRPVETESLGNRGRRKKMLGIHEGEAATVRRIYELYLAGHEGRSIADGDTLTILDAGRCAVARRFPRPRLQRGNKGKRINAPWIESGVIYRIVDNFADPAFLARTVAEARRMANGIEAEPLTIDVDIKRTEKQLANLMDLGAESGDKALLVKIRETEARINKLREEKAAWVERSALKKVLLEISVKDIRDVLTLTGIEIKSGKESLGLLGYGAEHQLPPDQLRKFLTSVLDHVELDANT